MIAVGYSFRDEPVNIAIAENLDRAEHSTLIVANPHPEDAIRNLDLASSYEDRIIPVRGEFGNEKSFRRLEEAVEVESRRRYEKRKWEKLKEKAI